MNDNNLCSYCSNVYDRVVYKWNIVKRQFEEINLCMDCLITEEENNNLFYCYYHERYEISNSTFYIREYGRICERAYYECEDFCRCSNCDEIYCECDLIWVDDYDCYYCRGCYEENKVIKSYHANKYDYTYNKLKCDYESNGIFYGIELEIANDDNEYEVDKEDLAKELSLMNDYFVYENDSSIGYGFEMISFPFSKNFMDTKLEEQLYHMLNKIKQYKFEGTKNCGLHFHVTKTSWDKTVDMVCLVEYFKEEFALLSKREKHKLTKWANFYTEGLKKHQLSREKIKEEINYSKYHAVNITQDNTVEFRFFSSTVDFEELMARYEIIYNLERYTQMNSIRDLEDINFFKVITYVSDKYVTKYLRNEFPQLYNRYTLVNAVL